MCWTINITTLEGQQDRFLIPGKKIFQGCWCYYTPAELLSWTQIRDCSLCSHHCKNLWDRVIWWRQMASTFFYFTQMTQPVWSFRQTQQSPSLSDPTLKMHPGIFDLVPDISHSLAFIWGPADHNVIAWCAEVKAALILFVGGAPYLVPSALWNIFYLSTNVRIVVCRHCRKKKIRLSHLKGKLERAGEGLSSLRGILRIWGEDARRSDVMHQWCHPLTPSYQSNMTITSLIFRLYVQKPPTKFSLAFN